MIDDIFWTDREFPGRIALVSRPRGGDWLEAEIDSWADAGLDVIVSMLEQQEIDEFELGREHELSVAKEIQFVSFPVPDRGVPRLDDRFLHLIDQLRSLLLAGKNIGIHCRQSIGRAPLLAAALLVADGLEADEAFEQLIAARGRPVPETREQANWIANFELRLAPVHS